MYFCVRSRPNLNCDGNISIMLNSSDLNTTTTNISNKWTLSYKPEIYADVTNRLLKIVPPVLIIVVTFGNSLAIAVFLRQGRKRSPTAVYLLPLAFSDLLILYLKPLRRWTIQLWNIDVLNLTNVVCKLHMCLTYSSLHFSSWLLVAVTIQWAISVLLPHKVKLHCTPMRAGKTVMVIFVSLFWTELSLFVWLW